MKNKVQLVLLWVFMMLVSAQICAQRADVHDLYRQEYDNQMSAILWRQYQDVSGWFEEAYREFPTVPRGVLEAVAFQYTRFNPNVVMDTVEADPSEKPRMYSVMGLTLHGKEVFRENARMLAASTPYSLDAILWEPGVAVKAYAHAFARLQREYAIFGDSLERYKPIFADLCELPQPRDGEDNFAMNSFLYMIYYFLDKEEYARFGVPHRTIDFDLLFGEEYVRLRSGRAQVAPVPGVRSGTTTPDYPGAVFVPAASCNYSVGRSGTTVTAVTIHYTQGTYAGSIAWFQNCSAKASAHYVIRSVDGQVTQMVPEADKAWHVGVANSYTIGIEHEAYGNIYSYFTTAMYESSADLVKNICSRRSNINPHRVFYRDTLDDGTVLNYGVHSLGGANACTQIRGHQHFPSQTHTDPGQYWDWNRYYKLINDNPTVVEVTDETGTFTDSGGPNGNYGDDERRLFRIHVNGADSVALTFQSFNLEPNYDFMWIYAGGSEFSPLLGRWNTQSPGRIVAAGDQMLVEFRSDCATNAAGWQATWQAVYVDPDSHGDDGGNTGGGGDGGGDDDDDDEQINDWEPDANEPLTDNAVPQTVINMDASQWITQGFTATFTDSDDSGLKWRFYQIMESDGAVWSARPEQGFLCDNFDSPLDAAVWVNNTSNPWTVQNGALCQNNASADYVGLAAHHNGASHTAYLYDFYLKFTNGEKCSFFFNCNNAPSTTSLFSGYEVCFDKENHTVSLFRLILGAKRLLKTNTQVYFQTGTSYLCRVVFDSSTGEIVVLRHANRIVRAVDNVLATTSDAYIGFVTRHAAVSIDNLRVYGGRGANVPISVGAAPQCNLQRQAVNGLSRTKLKSIVMDRAYKMSALVEKSLKVDYTAPSAVTNLALQTEMLPQSDGTMLVNVSASWSASSDAQSGIRGYYFHNAEMYAPSLSYLWTDNGLALSCHHTYTLGTSQVLTFSVAAENRAGLLSPPVKKSIAFPSAKEQFSQLDMMKWELLSGKSLHIHQNHTREEETDASGTLLYTLFDMAGKRVKEGTFHDQVSVDVGALRRGVYLLRVTCGPKVLLAEKVVLLR
jgi:N-acetyl-anhydromuramyl-L-alanine amidase AmpD